jgi:hypothetical protein
MGKTAETWREQVEPHFGFLTDALVLPPKVIRHG